MGRGSPPGPWKQRWRLWWWGAHKRWDGLPVQWCRECHATRGFATTTYPPADDADEVQWHPGSPGGSTPLLRMWDAQPVRCVVCGWITTDHSEFEAYHMTTPDYPQGKASADYDAKKKKR